MSNLSHVVTGEPFAPAAADWNAFVDTARTVRDQRVIFKPGPFGIPEQSSCDCCPPCCGTLWYVVNDEIIWTADHFEGLTDYDLTHMFDPASATGVWPWAQTCDTNSDGNVFHGGAPSRNLVPSLSKPQPPMYTLRSYDSTGNLRWSWSDFPNGYVSSGVRLAPNPIARVRCGGAHVFASQSGYESGTSHAWLRRHNPDTGAVIWSVDMSQMWTDNAVFPDADLAFQLINANADSVFVAASISSDSYTAIMTLDHDGNLLGTNRLTAHRASACWMDADGTIYVSTGGSPDAYSRMVGVYDNSCGFLTSVATISDTSFSVTSLRVSGGVITAANGTYIRTYTVGGSGSHTHTVTTGEKVMMANSADVGTKTDDLARIRNANLTARVFLTPQMAGDAQAILDAMPFSGGSVWCGRRWCGKTIEPDADTPTTTSTTTTSTSTTTGSTTTASTTSTTTASTTTSSTTTSSTTTGSTTTSSTTTESTTTASTTTGSTTTGSTSSTTAACTGSCVYTSWAVGSGSPTGWYWLLASSTCSTGCGCPADDAAEAAAIGRWPVDGSDNATISCS